MVKIINNLPDDVCAKIFETEKLLNQTREVFNIYKDTYRGSEPEYKDKNLEDYDAKRGVAVEKYMSVFLRYAQENEKNLHPKLLRVLENYIKELDNPSLENASNINLNSSVNPELNLNAYVSGEILPKSKTPNYTKFVDEIFRIEKITKLEQKILTSLEPNSDLGKVASSKEIAEILDFAKQEGLNVGFQKANGQNTNGQFANISLVNGFKVTAELETKPKIKR